jgi:hypothetical protein
VSPVLGHQGLTSVQGEVFEEALLKQEYFSIMELEIQHSVDTLLRRQETILQGKQPQRTLTG